MPQTPPFGNQTPGPGSVPQHLMRRRRQTYRLRRRQYTLAERLAEIEQYEAAARIPTAAEAAEPVPPPPQPPPSPDTAASLHHQITALHEQLAMAEDRVTQAQADSTVREYRTRELEQELQAVREALAQKTQAFEEARKVVENAKQQVTRSRKEMDQQRHRMQKEKGELQKYAAEEILRSLFPVVDHFTIAVESIDQGADPTNLVKGVGMIHREMMMILDSCGFKHIDAVGHKFDPRLHDGASTESRPEREDGEVLQVLRAGYLLNDKVLRPAMVIVNKLPETAAVSIAPESPPAESPAVDDPVVDSNGVYTFEPSGKPAGPVSEDPVPMDVKPDPGAETARRDPRPPSPEEESTPIPSPDSTKPRDPSESRITPIERARRMLETHFEDE